MSRRHGTDSEYTNHDCRCGECRAAHAKEQDRMRQARIKKLTSNHDAVEHGKYSTYVNWCCRCQLCRDAAHARYGGAA